MTETKVEVFYSKTCPHCPAQKELAKGFEEDVKVKLTDVARSKARAKHHGIRTVPTTVISGPGIDEKIGFKGVMEQEKLENAIKVAKGEEEPEILESGSLLSQIKEAVFG
ncbi:MAG: thioredoxin domain-containing protein [Candidatus Nanohaloarchaeota archaeon QJJ-9]|nr:thioredoxin domain-containing protein [Candidatus Nanohaloarchaeota archaeon QJJ-9]